MKVMPDEREAATATGDALRRLLRENVEARAVLENDKRGGGLRAQDRDCLLGKERVLARVMSRLGPAEHAIPEVQLDLGEYYMLTGRLLEAREALEKAATANPRLLRAQVLLARVAAQAGDSDAELRALRAALEAPGGAAEESRLWKSAFRSLRGRAAPLELLAGLKTYRALAPKDLDLLVDRVEIAATSSNASELDLALRELVSQARNPYERAAAAYYSAQRSLMKADDLGALDNFRTYLSRTRGLKTPPRVPAAWDRIAFTELARIQLRYQSPLVALAAAQEGLQLFPGDPALTAHLESAVSAIQSSGRVPASVQVREALRLSPTSTTLRKLWARSLLAEGRLENAEAQARLVTARDPADAEAWHLRGIASSRRQRFRAAQGYFNEAFHHIGFREPQTRLPANFPLRELVIEAARVEEARGDFTEATEILRRGLALAEDRDDKVAIRHAIDKVGTARGSRSRPANRRP